MISQERTSGALRPAGPDHRDGRYSTKWILSVCAVIQDLLAYWLARMNSIAVYAVLLWATNSARAKSSRRIGQGALERCTVERTRGSGAHAPSLRSVADGRGFVGNISTELATRKYRPLKP